jgi:hypothetical protein
MGLQQHRDAPTEREEIVDVDRFAHQVNVEVPPRHEPQRVASAQVNIAMPRKSLFEP